MYIPPSSGQTWIMMARLFHLELHHLSIGEGRCTFEVFPAHLWGDLLGGLYPDTGVPLSRGENCDLIQELVYPRQQVVPVLGMVGHIMENLHIQYTY